MLFRLLIGLISDITSLIFSGIGILLFIGILLTGVNDFTLPILMGGIVGVAIGIGRATNKQSQQKQVEQQKVVEYRDSPFDALDLEKEKIRRELLHRNEPIRREQSAKQQAEEFRNWERHRREREQTFECNVAGTTFGSRQKKIRTLYELMMAHDLAEVLIDLEPEPDNKHAPNAIKVIASVEYTTETASGKERHHKKHIGMIGYVPAEIAKQVSTYQWASASFKDASEFWSDNVGDDIVAVTIKIEAKRT